ncbi:MAG: carbamate kinase [Chloroflexi bacterium]|nr:MAG: carbamate kinase [Chloroflexota bacterium]
MSDANRKVAVVAIGGNSLIKDKQHTAVKYQWEAVRETCTHIADMIEQGWDVVITHGNGPQVGFILRRNELAAHELHTTPMDVIGADTQGSIGYMLQQALDNEFTRRGMSRRAHTIVTQVLVDRNDPAFQHPTKPIGGFLTKDEAQHFAEEGWPVIEDAGRGWRRVVPSPKPVEILEEDAIRSAVRAGWIVVAVGGGGIPVVRNEKGELRGVAAVIDKDLASGLLAQRIEADLFLISTAVEKVAINFGKPNQQWLDHMTVSEAKQYLAEGHFAPGSMKPKVEACIQFLEAGGDQALITSPENIARALRGETGTRIEKGN